MVYEYLDFVLHENGLPGTWNQIVLANVLFARMSCDHNRLPSLYRSKDDVVL